MTIHKREAGQIMRYSHNEVYDAMERKSGKELF